MQSQNKSQESPCQCRFVRENAAQFSICQGSRRTGAIRHRAKLAQRLELKQDVCQATILLSLAATCLLCMMLMAKQEAESERCLCTHSQSLPKSSLICTGHFNILVQHSFVRLLFKICVFGCFLPFFIYLGQFFNGQFSSFPKALPRKSETSRKWPPKNTKT